MNTHGILDINDLSEYLLYCSVNAVVVQEIIQYEYNHSSKYSLANKLVKVISNKHEINYINKTHVINDVLLLMLGKETIIAFIGFNNAFSATLHSDDITKMSVKLCDKPQWVGLKGKECVSDIVHQCIFACDTLQNFAWTQLNKHIITDGVRLSDNIQYLRYTKNASNLSQLTISEAIKLLKQRMLKRVIDAFEMDQWLVFYRTRLDCNNIHHYLTKLGGGQAFRGEPEAGAGNIHRLMHSYFIMFNHQNLVHNSTRRFCVWSIWCR